MIDNKKLSHIEETVIGLMINDHHAIQEAISHLDEKDFLVAELANLFLAIKKMHNKGQEVDIITLVEFLKKEKKLDSVGGYNLIQNLAQSVGSSSNISSYIKILLDNSRLKKLIAASIKIKSLAENSKEPIEDLMSQVEKQIWEITRNVSKQDFVNSHDFMEEAMDRMQKAISSENKYTGFQTGYEQLDEMTSGFQKGEYIIVAARPSMGKTAFALNLLMQIAKKNKKPVALFSLEMPTFQITNRLLAIQSFVEQYKIKSPKRLQDSEKEKLYLAADEISNLEIYINDATPLTTNQIVANARKLFSDTKQELSCIVIDYLTFINSNNRRDNRAVEVGDISAGLKSLARELNIPIIVLSQLSRNVEKRESKKPLLSDLRDSGAIEQDADLVMFLYRESYYDKEQDKSKPSPTTIIVGKNRNGPIGEFDLIFDPKTGNFTQ